MFGRRVKLFKLFGFEVRVDASWLIIAALVTWSLAAGVFPYEFPQLSVSTYWWMGALGALGLFGSIVVHELFHSLVARRYDLQMNGITLFVFGGVAEMGGEPKSPKAEFLMAIAGPIASILIGLCCYVVWAAARNSWPVYASGVVGYLAFINLALAAFNLIPAFPLDGGRVLRSAIWHFKGDVRRATRIASAIGSAFGWALVALGIFELLEGSLIAAVWYFLLGMFLRGASQSSYRELLARTALEGEPIRRFIGREPVAAPGRISIQEFVDDYVYRYHFKLFPVVADTDQLKGCVTTRDVQAVPRDEWGNHTVQEIAQPCSSSNTIGPDADAMQVLSRMRETGASRMIVADQGRLLAVVSLKDMIQLLAAKLDLEGEAPNPGKAA